MPRPTKCRRVCHFPNILEFAPAEKRAGEPIVMTLDEYEAIRLIDKEGLSQEECGSQLGVGRTTAQKIYENARKKLADALVLALPLRIEGGDIKLCNGISEHCYKTDCLTRRTQTEKGENIMRIAVTYKNGEIFQHFGHTEQFKVYDIDDGRITDSRIVDTNGEGHGALAGILNALNADILICGGIGGGAKAALASLGIKLYGGAVGNADAAVEAFLSNKLEFDPAVKCDHHNHEHGSAHHGCGKGSCGKH